VPPKTKTELYERFLRLPEVKARTGLSRTEIYALGQKGEFPKQLKIGARSVAWVASEVEEWVTNLIKKARKAEKEQNCA